MIISYNLSKILAVGIIVLFMGVSVSPIISAESISLFKEEIRNDKDCILFNQEGIFDIIFFRVRGRIVHPLRSIIDGLNPQLDIGIIFWNFNQHSIFVDYHLKIIGTRGDTVLIDMDFTDNEIHPHNGLAISIGNFGPEGYTFGPFDVILEVHNQNANRDRTVIYNGYVFEIGTMIFISHYKLV